MKPIKTIAIQGDQASFHDIATAKLFGDSGRVYCDTFAGTFRALAEDRADYAVVAIENSLYGSINEVYDLLLKHEFSIVAETYLRIEQCLIGFPGTKLEEIEAVYSHPVALAQCEEFLETVLPEASRNEAHDTAGSVAYIAEQDTPRFAAIASAEAAALYGMDVLKHSIETNKENYTRFVVLSKTRTSVFSGVANKSTLVVTTTHQPGALYDALGVFAKQGINLSKLQSRPIIGKAWHYMFYIDIAAASGALTSAKHELEAQGCTVTILGSYKSGIEPS